MAGPHEKMLAAAARTMLAPLGFVRKGRSRIWWEDHGWWLTVVEFQPHGSEKGSFLNVAAHWLWSEDDYPSFDYGGRVEPFTGYLSDVQFESQAMRLAEVAAERAIALKRMFCSVASTATVLAADARECSGQGGHCWSTYHAAVACGASGRVEQAAALFDAVRDDRVRPSAARLTERLGDPAGFRREVEAMIAAHREALRLPPAAMSALS